MEDEIVRMDLISKLPESILQHITSFLAINDVARTSIVSKSWNNAWCTHPELIFERAFFPDSNEYDPKLVRKSLGHVDHILEGRKMRNTSIRKFKLDLPYYGKFQDFESCIGKWVRILVGCGIKDLFLNLMVDNQDEFYTLPLSLFASVTLLSLNLRGFNLDSAIVKVPSLQELSLERMFISEESITSLPICFPNLEVLRIDRCHGFESFEAVSKFRKMKKLKMYPIPPQFQMLDVAMCSLETLDFCSGPQHHLKAPNVTNCNNLKRLMLNGIDIDPKWIDHLFCKLTFLEFFGMVMCNLVTLKISSNRLKNLRLLWCKNLIEVELHTPNLSSISYFGSPSIALSLQANSAILESASFRFSTPETFDDVWYHDLITFLGNFSHSKAVELSLELSLREDDKGFAIPKKLREEFLPPLSGTSHLSVRLRIGSDHSFEEDLDGILWLSPQLNTLSFYCGVTKGIMKFIYGKISDEEEKPCCKLVPIKCWHHGLKEVQFRNFGCCRGIEILRRYFLASTGLEMVQV